jgi:hypothetical protein
MFVCRHGLTTAAEPLMQPEWNLIDQVDLADVAAKSGAGLAVGNGFSTGRPCSSGGMR